MSLPNSRNKSLLGQLMLSILGDKEIEECTVVYHVIPENSPRITLQHVQGLASATPHPAVLPLYSSLLS